MIIYDNGTLHQLQEQFRLIIKLRSTTDQVSLNQHQHSFLYICIQYNV